MSGARRTSTPGHRAGRTRSTGGGRPRPCGSARPTASPSPRASPPRGRRSGRARRGAGRRARTPRRSPSITAGRICSAPTSMVRSDERSASPPRRRHRRVTSSSANGGAIATVTPSSSRRPSQRPGLRRKLSVGHWWSVPPMKSALITVPIRPMSWKSGSHDSPTSASVSSHCSPDRPRRFASTAACEITMPFGWPVVPDDGWMNAIGVDRAGGRRVAGRAVDADRPDLGPRRPERGAERGRAREVGGERGEAAGDGCGREAPRTRRRTRPGPRSRAGPRSHPGAGSRRTRR